ncbi:MAG: c-type cytochrome [Lentisphaeria bacterium]|nr:c-type cytochrome [Lentisphaeria bacterium]
MLLNKFYRTHKFVWFFGLAPVLALCVGAGAILHSDKSGGEHTVYVKNRSAFGTSSPKLTPKELRRFTLGNRMFNTNWVTAPASVTKFDGLGPIFNRISCSQCHVRDGRGKAPEGPSELMKSMLVRVSIPGESLHGGPNPHPVYGDQIQDRAIHGVKPDGTVQVDWKFSTVQANDGTVFELREPIYNFAMNYGPLGDDVMTSPRVAQAVFGLGLLEAISNDTILANVDEKDLDNDGISGRANYVWDVEKKATVLGRFGWKANQPNLRQQSADAARGDIGLTNIVFPDHGLSSTLTDAKAAPKGGDPELEDHLLDAMIFYMQTIGVPARRDVNDPMVIEGQKIFNQLDCAKCHIPSMETGDKHELEILHKQKIFPYSDLLLHDMGPDLADGRPDFLANGQEWRTAPLWGIGLQKMVNGHTHLLHDGRARNVTEAILWHGGEAQKSRDAFLKLNADQRSALIDFIQSL